jgi:hypothetical protein
MMATTLVSTALNRRQKMSVNQIVTELMSGALTNDDIEQVAQALKYARAKLVEKSSVNWLQEPA